MEDNKIAVCVTLILAFKITAGINVAKSYIQKRREKLLPLF